MTENYEDAKRWLSNNQKLVYEALSKLGESTDAEISRHLEWPINQITPRRNELVDTGLIVCCRKRVCNVTKTRVKAWMVQGGTPKPQGRPMEEFF